MSDNIGIGLGKNDREVSDSMYRIVNLWTLTLLITHIGKSQVGVFWNCDGNSSEKNNDNFNSRWPFLFNADGQKTRKEILQKLDTLDKKAETCLLSTQEDGLKKHITSYYKSLFGPENTSLTADFTIDETAMNRLGVMVMKGFSEKW
ncbi:hypothetical protein ACJX0J_008272, partial [Zea mays]